MRAVLFRQNIYLTLVSGVVRLCVGEGLCLGAVFGADVVIYLVVVAFGIKRRIDATKIDRLVADEFPKDIKIVAVVELVHGKESGKHGKGST